MQGTLNSPPTSIPRCSKKWNYRKSGLTNHKKSKKERRVIKKEIRALKSGMIDLTSEMSERHYDTLKQTNINQPVKRNGSANTKKSRHPNGLTKKVPSGHSSWKNIHQTKLH